MIEYDYNGRIYEIIPLKDMEIATVYKGECRNATYAYWNGQKFIHLRTKWNSTFLEEIHHPENDQVFDVFLPFAKADTDDANVTQLMNAINRGLIEKRNG